jgi:hypothetical protein
MQIALILSFLTPTHEKAICLFSFFRIYLYFQVTNKANSFAEWMELNPRG